MAFADAIYEPEVYQQMHFVLDESAPPFEEILPGLGNPHHRLAPELKPLYHAMCVLSGNFTTLLWQSMFSAMRGLAIPEDAALPYLRQISTNLQTLDQPLTGPLARGDGHTIQANLRALEGNPLQSVYASFVQAFAGAAVAR
jgi:predicted short-subunit dehydrogenase-like oxidoreductase (DUF2520 family)